MSKAQQHMAHNRAKRVLEYAQAHALHQQGWTMKAIATHMGRHHRTIKKYLEASTCPERPPRRRPPSILDPYKAYLFERWQAGYHSAKGCITRCKRRGLQGSTASWRRIPAAFVRLNDVSPDAAGRDHQRRSLQSTSR